MKPRVVLTTERFRIVRDGWAGRTFTLEERDGKDALGRQRWRRAKPDGLEDWPEFMRTLVGQVGSSLTRRERLARERRRNSAGGKP